MKANERLIIALVFFAVLTLTVILAVKQEAPTESAQELFARYENLSEDEEKHEVKNYSFALLILTSGDDGISLVFGDHRVAWDKEDTGVRVHDIVHREAADETVLKWDDNRVTSGVRDGG